MNRCIFLYAITVFTMLLMVGCSGGNSDSDALYDISDDYLYEVRIGGQALDPLKPNIVPLSKTNTLQMQFLKKFHPSTFYDSIRVSVKLDDITSRWSYNFAEADIPNNGYITFQNNEWGSLVTYTSNQPFNKLRKPGGAFNEVKPGDKLNVTVGFLRAMFEDKTQVVLRKDNLTIYCSRDIYERPVGYDDLNTDGFIQSIKLGDYEITDKNINIIPLNQVYEINLDFNTQLNPYTFEDLLNFRIIVNNYYDKKSYIIERANLSENGELFITDYVQGKVKLRLFNPITTLKLNGVTYYPVQPGDLIEVGIDFFSGENIKGEPFIFENKRFRIFYSST